MGRETVRSATRGTATGLPLLNSREFMAKVRGYQVPRDSIAIWTLGQNGFFAKSPEGTLIVIDPYLTDHCVTLNPTYGLSFDRLLPVFVEPEDLSADLVLLTHSHLDHTDPETIRRFSRKEETDFIAPWQSWRQLPDLGVPRERADLIHPLESREFRGLQVTATWSLPTDESDLNHIGFVIEFANGIKFYNTGDTAFHELLGHARKLQPQVLAICINGGFHNLSPWDAARVVQFVQPEVVIPTHFDMMACNQEDPAVFQNCLKAQGTSAKYVRLQYYEPYVFTP
jgi:L-ascorbate 6-phosphate lactonase